MPSDRITETDGLGVPMCRRACGWCQKDMGAAVCLPHQVNDVSHGICDACRDQVTRAVVYPPQDLARAECLESQRGLLFGFPAADAGSLVPSSSSATGVNDAAAALVPPGTSAQDKGTAAPGAYEPAALEIHPSGGPAASFTFSPLLGGLSR